MKIVDRDFSVGFTTARVQLSISSMLPFEHCRDVEEVILVKLFRLNNKHFVDEDVHYCSLPFLSVGTGQYV